jgi:hypothetical protein
VGSGGSGGSVGSVGSFVREMSVDKIVYEEKFCDLCSSLNITSMIVWGLHEEEV